MALKPKCSVVVFSFLHTRGGRYRYLGTLPTYLTLHLKHPSHFSSVHELFIIFVHRDRYIGIYLPTHAIRGVSPIIPAMLQEYLCKSGIFKEKRENASNTKRKKKTRTHTHTKKIPELAGTLVWIIETLVVLPSSAWGTGSRLVHTFSVQ